MPECLQSDPEMIPTWYKTDPKMLTDTRERLFRRHTLKIFRDATKTDPVDAKTSIESGREQCVSQNLEMKRRAARKRWKDRCSNCCFVESRSNQQKGTVVSSKAVAINRPFLVSQRGACMRAVAAIFRTNTEDLTEASLRPRSIILVANASSNESERKRSRLP